MYGVTRECEGLTRFLSVKEVSSILGVSESTCRRLVSKGEIEAIKVNRLIRIDAESLDLWISDRRYVDVMQKRVRRLGWPSRLWHKNS